MKGLGLLFTQVLVISFLQSTGAEPPRSPDRSKEVFTSAVHLRSVGGAIGGTREFFDDRGLVSRRIFYRARYEIGETTERGTPYAIHPADERTAVPIEIHDYWYDDQRRMTRRERTIVGQGLESILDRYHDTDGGTTTEQFNGDGALLTRRIHRAGQRETTVLYFAPSGGPPIGIDGKVPAVSDFDWGATFEGLSCATVVAPRTGTLDQLSVHVSLRNRSGDRVKVGWGHASVEARPFLVDGDDRTVPIRAATRAAREEHLKHENGGMRFGVGIAPGSARYTRRNLSAWYEALPPGRYRLILEQVGQNANQFVRCPEVELTVEPD